MRTAETVLNVIRDRGERGLPLEDIYRQLYNRELYLRAYGRLYSNQGAMTKGTTAETVDGMSLAKIDRIIDELRHERFRWTPVRRVNIPKPNGKTRPLGIPTWTDKLLQEVIRMILEAYYEPQFSDHSHGFRPDRGCHTALSEVVNHWTGVRWFVEGDIKGCFDNIDHEVMLSVLGEKLHDNRFLRLLKYLLKAGYMEEWKYGRTLSGTPQGGVVSPILANVYLDRLDKFVETVLIPANTRGTERRRNLTWKALNGQMSYHRGRGNHALALGLRKQMQQLPSGDPNDPGYRRLRYVRYADDFVLGFIGPKAEAEQIKESLETFLRDTLKLELSREKTLITHATSQAAKFLGYELVNQQANDKHDPKGRRRVNGRIGLRVPAKVIEQHCHAYMGNGKPVHRSVLIHDDDFTIMSRYQAEFRGVVQYYLLAQNVSHFGKLQWVMGQSLAKTLAAKHKTSTRKMVRRYKSTVQTEHGERACLKVEVQRGEGKRPLVAQFGGIPLKRKRQAVLVDQQPQRYRFERNELIQRLLANECDEHTRLATLNAIVRGWAAYYRHTSLVADIEDITRFTWFRYLNWLLAKHKGSRKGQLIREKTRVLHGRTRWYAEEREGDNTLEAYQWLPTGQELERQRYRQKGKAGFPHPYLSGHAEATGDHPQGETGPDERIYTATIGASSGNRSEPLELAGRKLHAKLRDGMICRKCGSRTDLHVHHTKGMKSHALSNLVTLCRTCHIATHRSSQLQTV